MKIIDFEDHNILELFTKTIEALSIDRLVIIRGFPLQEKLLESFALMLGVPNTTPRSMNEQAYFIQDVKDYRQPKLDPYGYEILSTTNYVFKLHTDNSCDRKPCDLVGLHCVRPASRGGETLFITGDDIEQHLSSEDIETLKEPLFAFPWGAAPILTPSIKGQGWDIRYNYKDILQCHETGSHFMTDAMQDFLSRVDRIFASLCSEYLLEAGHLVIFDNKKCLHGRKAFPTGDNRLLRRFRLFKKCDI